MRRTLQYLCVAALVCAGASVVFPYASAGQKDLNAQCVSYAKQFATACAEYAQDWDEVFPIKMTQPEIQNAVLPYLRDPAVFTCPASGVHYSPNASLSGISEAEFFDTSVLPVISDTVPHRDQKLTIAFLDGHVERGGKDAEDPSVECVSNVRSLTLGVLMYSQDYDDTLPPMQTQEQFQSSIFRYVKSSRKFLCPETHLLYTPNPILSGTLRSAYPDPAATAVLHDKRKHKDHTITTGYLDGHVERK